mmetsp:Transcript_4997/g.8148  ORF Transcript_4997/g.8148 Transcript_4997/m.8148 type:complete len:114 (-) Transcript_4997:3232-3573(-)
MIFSCILEILYPQAGDGRDYSNDYNDCNDDDDEVGDDGGANHHRRYLTIIYGARWRIFIPPPSYWDWFTYFLFRKLSSTSPLFVFFSSPLSCSCSSSSSCFFLLVLFIPYQHT